MPLDEWIKGDVKHRMKRSIKESNIIQEIRDKYKYEDIYDKSNVIQGSNLRYFIRLYNISRVERLFLKH